MNKERREKILARAQKKGEIRTRDIAELFSVSRQYAHTLLKEMVNTDKLIKIGSRKNAVYVTQQYAKENKSIFSNRVVKVVLNKDLEEHVVLRDIEQRLPSLHKQKENIQSIFAYAFSEMLNNAIEHSKSKSIEIMVSLESQQIFFEITDRGIGVFRNIMRSRKLHSELESIQDLLKGKTTTQPRQHSGEGIFFTSKIADIFKLESYGWELVVDNTIPDVFVLEPKNKKVRGTKVTFILSLDTHKHLNDIFKKFTTINNDGISGFDRTEIKIKLYTVGGVFVSRSQARRVLSSLEKFRSVVLDFDKVPTVGQAFADEVFRVFQNKHPKIKITSTNTNKNIEFMIQRAKNNSV